MSRVGALAVGAWALLLAGCDAGEGEPAEVKGPASAWVELAEVRFLSDGEGELVTIPAQRSSDALALRAVTEPGVCFQLSSAVDGEGRAVIRGRSAGEYCRECELRSSVAASAGVFVLAADAGRFAPEKGLSLRFARVACETLTPLTRSADRPVLRVEYRPIVAAPEGATIELRFLVAESSILRDDEARQQALVAALEQELASAGIVPRLVESLEIDALPTHVSFHAGDPSALAAALVDAPPRAERIIDVIFGGCLLYDDPIFGPPRAVDGFTPRIPGGAGPADAVLMPGLDCLKAALGPEEVPVRAQARVLAHELGHYLGLYHAVEADGAVDQLDDTGPDNIMHWNPGRAASVGFSPSQGRVMRAHPALRWGE